MTIIFYNDTVLPIECISTFGVSAKGIDHPIGYFGTGLKYALAVLMREGCRVRLIIEGQNYEITSRQKEIRGKFFDLIYMNDIQLSFTTELGRNWDKWQAYRELYSNCMDEQGRVVNTNDPADVGVMKDSYYGTAIFVDGLTEVHESRQEFILQSEPKWLLSDELEIHASATPAIFYKGIRVLELNTKYSYNILSDLDLTEDRTACQSDVEHAITRAMLQCNNIEAVSEIIQIEDEKFFESKIEFSKYLTPSPRFMSLVASLKKKPTRVSAYYNHHYPSFMGKLDRGVLSKSVTSKLDKLKSLLSFAPKEIFVTTLTGEDYKIIDEGICINSKILDNRKRLEFVYLMATYKTKYKQLSTYELMADHILAHYELKTDVAQEIRKAGAL